MKRRRDEDGAGVAEAVAVSEPANVPVTANPLVRAATNKLRLMWEATQPATYANVSGVTLTRDEAAALYEVLR